MIEAKHCAVCDAVEVRFGKQEPLRYAGGHVLFVCFKCLLRASCFRSRVVKWFKKQGKLFVSTPLV